MKVRARQVPASVVYLGNVLWKIEDGTVLESKEEISGQTLLVLSHDRAVWIITVN